MAEFEFNGMMAIPVFKISIQINPEFASYFKPADMAQIEIKKIDPATLAREDKVDALSFDDVYSDSVLETLFGGK